ncbi:hypothetical protein QJS04_geneDACA009719 [Acorus gramineus]|uniref:Uncharacterized protein n=1 Tax=Acorus gramineus TaxID=55184 RepID=A0AAV9BDN9_ACOGR|nr:hypothetical protein QJS04_geneDACA009719 [Acorus gramineus]
MRANIFTESVMSLHFKYAMTSNTKMFESRPLSITTTCICFANAYDEPTPNAPITAETMFGSMSKPALCMSRTTTLLSRSARDTREPPSTLLAFTTRKVSGMKRLFEIFCQTCNGQNNM